MRRPQGGASWGTVGLVAFLVCDVILIGAAFAHVRGDGAGDTAFRTPSTPNTSQDTGASGSSASRPSATEASPSTSTSSPSAAGRLGIVAVDETHAWRFSTGTCATGGATVEVTADSAKSWERRVAPFEATTRVRVRPDGSAFAVGGDPAERCAPQFRQTSDQAKAWGPVSKVADAWYLDLRDPTKIGTSAGATASPCGKIEVLEIAVPDGKAIVLCGDGRVTESSDGDTWKALGVVKGGLSVAGSARGVMVARDGGQDCDGLAVVEVSANDQVVGCVQGVDQPAVNEVSLSVAGDSWWLRVGADTWLSKGDAGHWRSS